MKRTLTGKIRQNKLIITKLKYIYIYYVIHNDTDYTHMISKTSQVFNKPAFKEVS